MFAGIYLLSTCRRANGSLLKSSEPLPRTTTCPRQINRPDPNATTDEMEKNSNSGSSIMSKFTSLMNQSINAKPSKNFMRSVSSQYYNFNPVRNERTSLRNEVHKLQSHLSWEVGRLYARDQLKFVDSLKDSLIEASKELLSDESQPHKSDSKSHKFI